jgi:hypothetical protein
MTHRLKFIAVSGIISAPAIQSQNCNLSEYKPAPGLTADDGQKTLTVAWDGEKNEELRLRLSVWHTGNPGCSSQAQKERHGSRWQLIWSRSSMSFQASSG